MEQIAPRAHLLQCEEIAAFVMDAGHAVAHELLGDVGEAVAIALQRLFGREGLAFSALGVLGSTV